MATKKQKHAAALARREARLAEIAERGLKAQQMDQARRAAEERAQWRDNHDKRHSWRKRIQECPICQDEIKAAKRAGRELSIEQPPTKSADGKELAETG